MQTKIKSGKFLLSAIIEKPKNAPHGLVVFLPGYLDSKDSHSFVEFEKTLVTRGFITIRFDPTGTWESGGTIKDYSISQYLKDIKQIIAATKKKNKKIERIILIGHSLGGMLGAIYAAQHKEISAVVAIMPPQAFVRKENFHERAEKWKEKGFKLSIRHRPEDKKKTIEFKVPYHFVKNSLKYNVLEYISKVRVPIILMAGEYDKRITPKSVKEIYDHANEPKKFVILKKVGHDFRQSEKETQIVNKKIWEIVKELF